MGVNLRNPSRLLVIGALALFAHNHKKIIHLTKNRPKYIKDSPAETANRLGNCKKGMKHMVSFIKKPRNAITIGIIILFAAGLVYFWGAADKVTAYRVQKQNYIPSLLLSGEVITESNAVLSAECSGTVLQCPVQKGAKVKKDQLIVQLNDSQARLDRDRAAVAVQIAGANLQKTQTVTLEAARSASVQADLAYEQAQRQLERSQVLANAGAVSQQELENARQKTEAAREEANAARIALEALQINGSSLAILQGDLQQKQLDLAEKELLLKKYQIRAPFSGTILDLNAEAGELLSAGSQAAVLSGAGKSRVRIKPDQRYAALAALNNQARVWLPNNSKACWTGRVAFLEPSGNADQGYLTAEISLGKQVAELYPGQLVTVQLFGAKEKNAILLDDQYLSTMDGQTGVWLLRGQRAHFQNLETGLRSADGVVILSGLKEGDVVLIPAGLAENQRVKANIQKGSKK